ncbi:MAG: GNAT family N-acetyltransferase [Vicingaceae bacterium]
MLETKVFNATNKPTELEKGEIANFLFKHLEEYGDPKEDILNCMSYALKERVSFGGFVVAAVEENEVIGAVIVNKTGMSGYIPENILVYIAIHNEQRGKGLGKLLMEKTISLASGDIALHVEKDNPAKFLYEKYGFTSPYLEMRYKRKRS